MEREEAYDEWLPAPCLATRVRTVWVQHTGPQPTLHRNLPTGGIELQCPIGGTPRLVGPLTRAEAENLPPGETIVGARFWPGAASHLLSVPANELVDQVVPLCDVWIEGERLATRFAAAPGPVAGLRVLQAVLAQQQAGTTAPDALVTEAVLRLMPWRPTGIGSITEDLSISESQLRRRFLTEVGIGPKTLQRVLRFQGYLALAQASASVVRVADLAAEVGYADQAHLARECLRLTGQTPRELLGGATERCGCGHDHVASYGPFLASRRASHSQSRTLDPFKPLATGRA